LAELLTNHKQYNLQINRVQIENWSFETEGSGARSQELSILSSKY